MVSRFSSHVAMKDVRQIIGENVRVRREAAGLSQEKFAATAGVEQSYLSGLEAGKRNPTALTILDLAMALKVKPGSLFDPPPISSAKGAAKGRGRPRK